MKIMSLKWCMFLYAILTIINPGVNAELRELTISYSSSVSERTMKSILESCYDNDDLSETVVVVGDFNEYIDKLPTIRINNFENLRPDSLSNFRPTRVFIIVDFINELEEYIESLKKMSWWNYMASFFIIVKTDQMCNHAVGILYFTTINNMINSVYICSGSMNTSILYTMNQYADYAPHPWEILVTSISGTWFSQLFDKNMSCRNLNYDKTIELNKHQIRLMGQDNPRPYSKLLRNYLLKMRDDLLFEMIFALSKALNCKGYQFFSQPKRLVPNSLHAGLTDLVSFESDIEEDPHAKFLYPHSQNRIVAVIKSSPEKSIQRKILQLCNFFVIFLAFIALAILFVIMSWKNHEFFSALLNIIRLIIHSSIQTNIRSNSFRIFFTIILIMVIIINGIFQGEIATFLTAHGENAAIERIEILVQLGYNFYCTPRLQQSIELLCPECRAMTVELDECFKHVLEDGHTACLTEELIYQHVTLMPFELVKEPLVQSFLVTKCRNEWPLYDRVNDMWMRIIESGLAKLWRTQKILRSFDKCQVQDIEQSATQYQPIKLHDLLFAFKFLAVGLLLSTLVFIGELLLKNYRCVRWLNQQCAG